MVKNKIIIDEAGKENCTTFSLTQSLLTEKLVEARVISLHL